MKIYLVGGAVRDQLLELPIKERDYVVVGATPAIMLQQGYQQVGRDFPVFLHPKTHEEYALARKERKTAPGYYGFQCDFSDSITLEEDLLRRDLTINAMAMDEKGNIIDPFHGKKDLEAKYLRHVSDAFIEDPVRVLRVARFAARYHYLGFRLADETRLLMYNMAKRGELTHLVPERVWQEWAKSLEEKHPEKFIETLRQCGALKVILPEVDQLFGVPNPPKYHPEVDSGIHTLMVLQKACELSKDPVVRFAAFLHDLGKARSPMNKWPSHHGHEEKGVAPIKAICKRLKVPASFREFAIMCSRFHLVIHQLNELKATTIVKLFERSDAFRRPQLFNKLLFVCEADALGRTLNIVYDKAEKWRHLLAESSTVSIQSFIADGHSGEAIKNELHARRVSKVQKILTGWKNNNH